MTNITDIEIGQRVRAEQVLGDGWTKTYTGEVTDIEEEWPLPMYDGAVVFVDDEPVRAENVEVLE